MADIQTARLLGANIQLSTALHFCRLPTQGFDRSSTCLLRRGNSKRMAASALLVRRRGPPWSMIAASLLHFPAGGNFATAATYHINPRAFALYWWRTCGPEASHQYGLLAAFFSDSHDRISVRSHCCRRLLYARWRREAHGRQLGQYPLDASVGMGLLGVASAGEHLKPSPHSSRSTQLANMGISTEDRVPFRFGVWGLVFAASLLTPLFLMRVAGAFSRNCLRLPFSFLQSDALTPN